MNVDVVDLGVMRQIRPFQLELFLSNNGWTFNRPYGKYGAIWTNPDFQEKAGEVLVPTVGTVDDYAERVLDLVRKISTLFGRSPPAVCRDLLSTDADLLRLRFVAPESADGSVPADVGVALFRGVRDLLMAGACSAIYPNASHPNRKPERAIDFVKRLRFGQTELGSFVVTLLSYVAPEYTSEGALLPTALPEPFERMAVRTAFRAAIETRRATDDFNRTADLDSFVRSVPIGVSANLCSTLSDLLTPAAADASFELSVSWSAARRNSEKLPSSVSFFGRDKEVLAIAAEKLRDEAPYPDFELIGSVFRLTRKDGETSGTVAVSAIVGEKARQVQITLAEKDYEIAINAHQQHQLFFCTGTLVKLGKGWELVEPRNPRLFTEGE